MPTTDDPFDPRLTKGVDSEETEQAEVYLVLPEEERASGFVRPVRRVYIHQYMADGSSIPGEPWKQLPEGLLGCGGATMMSKAIAETYAKNPGFYGSTFCVVCRMHLPVSQFHWEDGTKVGS